MPNTKERVPNLLEYTALVKERLSLTLTHISADELDRYMNDAETKTIIKESYDYDIADLNSGDMTYREFMNSSASGVGYALDLLY